MPGRRLGTSTVSARYLGNTPVTARYLGTIPIWSSSTLRDDFNRADALDLSAGGIWVDQGSGPDFKAGVVNQTCRMNIPDIITASFQTSRMRYAAAVSPDDDGYIETLVATQGDGTAWLIGYPLVTQVFGRLSNAAFSHGVGIQLDRSGIRIVRMVAGVEAVVLECGAYAAGDRVRLTQTGNLHTLSCNGSFRGEWNDTGATASRGAGFRSLGVRLEGVKFLVAPRQFSPALDYVEYG